MPKPLLDTLRLVRRVPRVLAGRDFFQRVQTRVPVETAGAEHVAWTFATEGLSEDSIVYSFGVGEDVSFDLALVEHYGLRVHAFDPTPRSLAWIERQSLPDGFTFHPWGVAGFDGTAAFHAPAEDDFVSFSMVNEPGYGGTIEAPVYRLQTIMERLGHGHVDVVKMDIEGAEYEVVDDLVASGVDVPQLLVEFHHRFRNVGVERTKAAVRKLNHHGYRVFHVSPRGDEFSFVRSRES